MRFFLVFPLMIIPVALYNILAISGSTFSTAENVRARLDTNFQSIDMMSGSVWEITVHCLPRLWDVCLFLNWLDDAFRCHGRLHGHDCECASRLCRARRLAVIRGYCYY